jgi:hypothetical protein
MTDLILTEIAGGVATVTLNRPEAMNALSKVLRHRLYEVMTTLDADDSVRAVILTGAGERALRSRACVVRSGVMIDLLVPYQAIAGIVPSFGAEQVKAPGTLNHAVLSWPSAMLELDRELTVCPLLGVEQQVRRIALRIDDSAAFLDALEDRVPQLRG